MITKLVEAEIPRPIQVVSDNPPRPAQSAPPQPKRRSWAWLGWLLFWAAVGAGVYYGYRYRDSITSLFAPKPLEPKPKPPTLVVVAKVSQGNIDLYLNGLGTVVPLNTVTVRARVEGELINIPYKEGELVNTGDLIAEIDSRPYQVQLTQAKGQLAKDEAALVSAKLDLDRYNSLIASKSVNQQQVDAQVALVQQDQAVIQTDRGKIDEINLNIKYCRITAPISGTIGLRNIDLGNMVRTNDVNGLAVITQLQPIAVVFTVPQDEISRLQKQIVARRKANDGKPVLIDAYDKTFTTKLGTGKLLAVDNQVDATTGTLKIKAEFPNEDRLLFPNQFVNAKLLVDTLNDATLVAPAAVQRGPNDMTYVYVVGKDEKVELRKVELGPTEGDSTVITKGLQPGEIVVTDGVDKLTPKAKVAVRAPGNKGDAKDVAAKDDGADDASPSDKAVNGTKPADSDQPTGKESRRTRGAGIAN